jgi:hypothetical protein
MGLHGLLQGYLYLFLEVAVVVLVLVIVVTFNLILAHQQSEKLRYICTL